jgi:Tol biopolymer transport system component
MLWGAGGVTVLCLIMVGIGILGGFFMMGSATPTAVPQEAGLEEAAEIDQPPVAATATLLPAAPSNTPETAQADQPAAPTAAASDTPIPPATAIPPSPTPELPRMIAYVVGAPGYTDIYVADENGGSRKCVACDPDHDQAEPGWSADGREVVFHANYDGSYDIWAVDRSGGAPRKITTDASSDEREPDWSADGKVVYRVNPLDSRRDVIGDLWVLEVGSSNSYPLGVKGRGPAWSPDGSTVLYMSDADGKWKIYTFDLASGNVSNVASCTSNCRWPCWSPDAQWIAYNTTTSEYNTVPEAVWLSAMDHGEWTNIASERSAGRPSWSSNGLIAFNTNDGIEVVDPATRAVRLLIDDPEAWAPAWSR